MKKHKVMCSNKEIWFDLEYKNIKNLNLSVKPDQSIYVSVPLNTPINRVESFVESKTEWILKKRKEFNTTKTMQNEKKEYVSGETFKYLGRQYRLKIKETTSKEHVTIKSGYILLYVKKKDDIKRKKNLLNTWFKNRAHIVFQEVMNEVYPLVENIIKAKPSLKIKVMTKRWGSCLKSKNVVLLNYELIKAPKYCISYVVLHEFIHFSYKNHDPKFYNLLTVLMPDWKERKIFLDEEVIMYI
jgi:predicted metal-dependent hydrolase